MCGSYRISFKNTRIGRSILEEAQRLDIKDFAVDDVYPGCDVLTIIPKEDKVSLDVKKWGIPLSDKKLINARVESLNDKPFYLNMKDNRCSIPVSGFYEWNKKERYQVRMNDEELFYLAGICNENNELLILTGRSEDELSKIHDRSPILMNKREMLGYLSGKDIPSVNNRDISIQLDRK
ncbi:MAG: SOS response-associated peptidase family protein [Erysipelotrichaceae bacterium]|nr:SOS response-associated peptidase family protein [Erysipelotrichaceae bacterium]